MSEREWREATAFREDAFSFATPTGVRIELHWPKQNQISAFSRSSLCLIFLGAKEYEIFWQNWSCILGQCICKKLRLLFWWLHPVLFGRELSYSVSFVDHKVNTVNTHCLLRYVYWCTNWISSMCSIKLIYQVVKKPPSSLSLSLARNSGILGCWK